MAAWIAYVVLVLTVFFVSAAGMLAAVARAQDVATLERAEAVLTALDDEPPPLPPAIPMSMRDPAFQRRDEKIKELTGEALRVYHVPKGVKVDRGSIPAVQELLAQPLIADRRFTLLTHCQRGHVATHWLGRITTWHHGNDGDRTYVERICRFERCAATWQERA